MDLRDKKILVTGGNGFLGRRVVATLKARGVPTEHVSTPHSHERDLRVSADCRAAVEGQDVVIHLAAIVGGIGAHKKHPGKFFYDNALMGLQLMEEARLAGVTKFVSVGTVCEYPKFSPVPFAEDDLWNGYPEETNAPYALAKKMLLVQAQAYRQEYGFNSVHLLPVNLYGPEDNFNPESSHVIPALIRRVSEAKKNDTPFIEVWGTGTATREFIYIEDAAEGVVAATERYDSPEPVNIGSGKEVSIKDLIGHIVRIMEYTGEIRWDTTKPDGQPRRQMDVSRAKREFGFEAKVPFDQGLQEMISWYMSHPEAGVV